MYQEWAEVEVPAATAAAAGRPAGYDAPTVEAWFGDLYYWSLFSPMVLPSTAIVRRAAIGQHDGFYDDNQVGDWDFFARLSHRCGGVFVPVETTLNRSHNDTFRLTRVDPRIRVLQRLNLIRRVWRTDPAFVAEHRADVDRVEAGCLRQFAKISLSMGDTALAREALQTIRILPDQTKPADAVLRAAAKAPGSQAAIVMLQRLRRRLRPRTGGF
jgi:hypothetical protein